MPSSPRLPAWFLAAVFACIAAAGTAAPPTVEEALGREPRQKGVDFDRPGPDEIKGATIKQEKFEGVDALVVRGPDGRVLRAYADTNGDRVVDRWSFFKDGLEVFREFSTAPGNAKADQARWLNSGGSRWGVDRDADGTLDAWKEISAEEATAEIVAALRNRDAAAFARLLPTREDLQAAGFAGERLEQLAARAAAAREQFAALAAAQRKIGPNAIWVSMLAPQAPGVVPAGSDGVTADVTAYDNVMALAEEQGESVQLLVGSLVRCGNAWRPIDAPQFSGDGGEVAEVRSFFAPVGGASGAAGDPADDALRPLIAELAAIDAAMAKADPAERGRLAARHVAIHEQIVAATEGADRTFWTRQLVELVSAYVQDGSLPDGLAVLDRLAAAAGEDDAAFVAFRVIQARYAAAMADPAADAEKLQAALHAEYETFIAAHPKAPEAAEAMLQLALRDEFSGREAEAIERYKGIATAFPDTPVGRKAAGAVRRLESVGKPLEVAGKTPDGKAVSLASFKGGPVLLHFWSTDCEPCKVDLARIRELHAKYSPQRFGCVGISLDGDPARLTAFLRERPLPWPQLFEAGGLDSRLAEELGVQALPTMLLLDAQGNVVDRNVSITELEKKLEELLGGK